VQGIVVVEVEVLDVVLVEVLEVLEVDVDEVELVEVVELLDVLVVNVPSVVDVVVPPTTHRVEWTRSTAKPTCELVSPTRTPVKNPSPVSRPAYVPWPVAVHE
jgi:hypothetical protein